MIEGCYDLTQLIGYPSYAMAIILFTVIQRILMFPLNLIQAKSTKGMALLAPTQKRLRQQYKNDTQILNRELSALYKKYNVNPMAGCLPMVIQLPILFALYSALRSLSYTDVEAISFFWLPTMSDPDPTPIMPIIVGLSSYLQQKLMMNTQPEPDNDQQKMMNQIMLYGMPVMLAWMTRTFAAGLALYWSTTNILGFLMQIVINALVNRSQADIKDAIEAEEARLKADKDDQRQKQRDEAKVKAIEKKKDNISRAAEKAEEKKRNQQYIARRSRESDNKGKELDFDDFS
jgi:YidC/Oxa1 family membrane protein insertase